MQFMIIIIIIIIIVINYCPERANLTDVDGPLTFLHNLLWTVITLVISKLFYLTPSWFF